MQPLAMVIFTELGTRLEQRWAAVNYAEPAFPDLAAEVLAESNLPEETPPQVIMEELHRARSLPQQSSHEFSDLSLTLYSSSRFCIDVYFWLESTTAIHQHAFSGAFQVLSGSSIHTHYTFEFGQQINSHFSVGTISMRRLETLAPKDIRQIYSGNRFIHSLFHLDAPSVTVVIRTHRDVTALPQFTYLKPCFAIDPFFTDEVAEKKVRSIRMLLRLHDSRAYSVLDQLIASSDFQTTFEILRGAFAELIGDERANTNGSGNSRPEQKSRFAEVLAKARSVHGPLIDLTLAVLLQRDKQLKLAKLRAILRNPEHRFLLALLLNIEERKQMFDLIQQRYPDRLPVDSICRWLQELSVINNTESQSILGIGTLSELHLLALRHLLTNRPINELTADTPTSAEVGKAQESFKRSLLINSILSTR